MIFETNLLLPFRAGNVLTTLQLRGFVFIPVTLFFLNGILIPGLWDNGVGLVAGLEIT